MAEMPAALGAQHFRALHQVAVVFILSDHGLGSRRVKARPAAAGIKLGVRLEQHLAAARTAIHALVFRIPILPCERALRSFLAQHAVLLRC